MTRYTWEEYLYIAVKEYDTKSLLHIAEKCPDYTLQAKATELINQITLERKAA